MDEKVDWSIFMHSHDSTSFSLFVHIIYMSLFKCYMVFFSSSYTFADWKNVQSSLIILYFSCQLQFSSCRPVNHFRILYKFQMYDPPVTSLCGSPLVSFKALTILQCVSSPLVGVFKIASHHTPCVWVHHTMNYIIHRWYIWGPPVYHKLRNPTLIHLGSTSLPRIT